MLLRSSWVLVALICGAGCNKSEKKSDTAATETAKADGDTKSSTTKIERWATPPTFGSKFNGGAIGGDLTKIDPWGGSYTPGGIAKLGEKGGAGVPTFADKIDLTKLDKAAEEPSGA